MNDSGSIQLDGDQIRYASRIDGDWTLPLADIRIIGEATNQMGPYADDYFLCFATGPAMWFEAPFSATGIDRFLKALSAKLGHPLETSLVYSTDFASRVLWPPHLAGQPMFKFTEVPPKTWIGRLFGPTRNHQTYSDPVAAALASASTAASHEPSRRL